MTASSSGFAEIDRMVAKLRGLPAAIEAAAPSLALSVKHAIDENIAASRGPDGTAWPATKDGSKPLANAAKAITSSAVGTSLVFTLRGPEVWHQFGTTRTPQRQIFPVTGLPLSLAVAIRKGVVELFNKEVRK